MGLAAEAYARMLGALLPPGKLWRLTTGSVLSKLLLGCADELARVDVRAADLLDESDPTTASEMLPEYEAELDIAGTGTDDERRARIVALLVRRQRFRPVDFKQALAELLAQDAAAVVVLECSHGFAASLGDDREIFRFFVYRNPALPGTYFVASAQAVVDAMKPSHTKGTVIESISALYDSPFTLYDRDLMGV